MVAKVIESHTPDEVFVFGTVYVKANQFEADIGKFMPPHVAHDLRLMYEVWQREGFLASREEIEQLTSLLGHPPRNYLSFCEEMAKVWGLVQAAKSA